MPNLSKKNYLPEAFSGIYFGMSIDEFTAGKPTDALKVKTSDYVSYISESVDAQGIDSYIYQFDRHRLLYQIIIQVKPGFDALGYITQKYGQPNEDHEKLVRVSDFLYLKIWTYHNRICIANAVYFKEEILAHEAA